MGSSSAGWVRGAGPASNASPNRGSGVSASSGIRWRRRRIQAQALEGADAAQEPVPTLAINWDDLLPDIDPATTILKQIFLR